MKHIFLISAAIIIAMQVSAQFVPLEKAAKVAKTQYYQCVNEFRSVAWDDIKTVCLFDPSEDEEYSFYVFNVNNDDGYVLVSSDAKQPPVLAYSLEAGFNHDNMSPAQASFLSYYSRCVEYSLKNDYTPAAAIEEEWGRLLGYRPGESYPPKSTSPVLLGGANGIQWNQVWPYNNQCPADADAASGLEGHCPVGCVAIAMAQIMKYYNWPPRGAGQKTSSRYYNGGYPNATINFANHTYDWSSIPTKSTGYENPELGKLCYHAAVACNMQFSPEGSGSTTEKIPAALKTNFKYSQQTKIVSRQNFFTGADNYTESQWIEQIRPQIDNRRPVVYSGSPSGGGSAGHAWVCDGYQDDQFHMNWGWGGYGDGYFNLNNLVSQATAGSGSDNFNAGQQIVINIYPEGDYPEFCNNVKTVTGKEGSFDDGSSTSNYKNNQHCTYYIDPTCGEVVALTFLSFDLAAGDELRIYDGDGDDAPLLYTFSKDNPPQRNRAYTHVNGGCRLEFDTDGSGNAAGWQVKYLVKNCGQNTLLTARNGVVTDGSHDCDYEIIRPDCSWIIEPAGGDVDSIMLTFDEFDLYSGDAKDKVRIYRGDPDPDNVIYLFTSEDPPTGAICVDTSKVSVKFHTDGEATFGGGFRLHYTAIGAFSGNVEPEVFATFDIMPNPADDASRLWLSMPRPGTADITISNVIGQVIASTSCELPAGETMFTLREIAKAHLNNGVYVVNVRTDNTLLSKKIVVVNR